VDELFWKDYEPVQSLIKLLIDRECKNSLMAVIILSDRLWRPALVRENLPPVRPFASFIQMIRQFSRF